MVFSNEEKQIWQKSEVMKEFERMAQENGDMFEQDPNAHMPLEESSWEDETSDEDKLTDAAKNLTDVEEVDRELEGFQSLTKEDFDNAEIDKINKELEDFISLKNHDLMDGLQKLASYMAKSGKHNVAHKIENTILDIKISIKENDNG